MCARACVRVCMSRHLYLIEVLRCLLRLHGIPAQGVLGGGGYLEGETGCNFRGGVGYVLTPVMAASVRF